MRRYVFLLTVLILSLAVREAVATFIYTVPLILLTQIDTYSYDDDTTLHFYWSAASGNVDHYNVYLYVGGVLHTEVWATAIAPTVENPYTIPLVVEHGKRYQLVVEAEDASGSMGPKSEFSDTVVVDLTRPTAPIVTDGNDYTDDPTQLYAAWTESVDPESGIDHYQYIIGTTAGGSDVKGWTSTNTEIEVTVKGLSLILGKTYYFGVRAVNGARTVSDLGISDGIRITFPAPGRPVRLE